MKREILFEVLREDNNEVVGLERIGERGQWEHIRVNRDEWLLGAITDGQEYSKFIRRQFTGLTDNNETKIFDGDILKSNCNKRLPKINEDDLFEIPEYKKMDFYNVVDWFDGVKISGWRLKGKRFQTKLKWSTVLNMRCEVVGNIYQNPELLK